MLLITFCITALQSEIRSYRKKKPFQLLKPYKFCLSHVPRLCELLSHQRLSKPFHITSFTKPSPRLQQVNLCKSSNIYFAFFSGYSPLELLWSAPEAIRGGKNYPKHGTQAADVFSFGIIMQEVVVRGEPYCMLSLTPEEIIAKIKKPPPLIRPSVSKGAAPPEAINIMRQCWSENPELRPDFAT